MRDKFNIIMTYPSGKRFPITHGFSYPFAKVYYGLDEAEAAKASFESNPDNKWFTFEIVPDREWAKR